jgi:DNA replication and repair protein RecF
VLQQRNSLLKAFGEKGYTDDSLLDILTEQLVKPGKYIYNFRKKFLIEYLPAVAKSYLQIAGTEEPVLLEYYSPLHEDEFEKLLAAFRQKDLMLQRTTLGIHKDDLELKLNGEDFKNIASQGQRKSLLFALKLKEFDELKSAKGFAPVLLLDDVFEKLDAGRIQNLLQQVCVESESQVFITDTHKERLQQSLEKLNVPFQLIEL